MLTNDAGNVVGFHCKLCDCTLTDPNGRIAHLKGRRHRLAFKVQFSLLHLLVFYLSELVEELVM
jgi:hypothetical protein